MPLNTRRDALPQIERAMVRIRRSQTRRTLGRFMEHELGTPFNMAHSFVVDALDETSGVGGKEPSVGTVAECLGVDPSRASRMVADAIRGGYVRRIASQADGRRIGLQLTDSGRKLLKTTSRFRRHFFAQVMASWPDRDCAEFARLLTKFTQPLQSMRVPVTPARKPWKRISRGAGSRVTIAGRKRGAMRAGSSRGRRNGPRAAHP
jgi:DNA-binding MarR family transcriptional regulator